MPLLGVFIFLFFRVELVIVLDGIMIVGCPRGVNKDGNYRIQRHSGHQHNISSFVCCDCFMLSNLTLQTHVILVRRAFGGSILHWWCRGATHYLHSFCSLLLLIIVAFDELQLFRNHSFFLIYLFWCPYKSHKFNLKLLVYIYTVLVHNLNN